MRIVRVVVNKAVDHRLQHHPIPRISGTYDANSLDLHTSMETTRAFIRAFITWSDWSLSQSIVGAYATFLETKRAFTKHDADAVNCFIGRALEMQMAVTCTFCSLNNCTWKRMWSLTFGRHSQDTGFRIVA